MHVQPYLDYNGRCQEALNFYQSAIGAEIVVQIPFKDAPDKEMVPPGAEDKVMHSELRIGSTVIMASDGRCQGEPTQPSGISLCLQVGTPDDARSKFEGLSQGGKIDMPLEKTFWSPLFGCVTDRFGVSWMVMVEEQAA